MTLNRSFGAAVLVAALLTAGCGLTGNETADLILEEAAWVPYYYAVW